jgi:hypothetical protein
MSASVAAVVLLGSRGRVEVRRGFARGVVLAICGIVIAGCSSSPTGPNAASASRGPNDLVRDWQSTLDQGTARLSLSEEPAETELGYIDFKHNTMDLTPTRAGTGESEIRVVGGYAYILNSDPAPASSLMPSMGTQFSSQPPQQWLKTKESPGQGPLDAIGPLGLWVSSTQMLAAYVKNARYQDLGTATLLAISTTHYRLTKTATLAAHTFPGHGSIAAGTISTLTLDLYVSSDNLVRRISYQESIAPGLASSTSPTTSVAEKQTLDLSDFGVPFTASAPPPAEVASG